MARCACAAGLVLSFAYTISCLRLEASPWGGWHPSNLAADYSLETPAFRGWRCNRANGEGVDAAVRFLDANVPREDSLFVAPDGTIIYGLTGHDSYRKTPFIVHVGSPPRGQLMSAFRSHFYSAPPRWIVIHRTEEVIHMRTGDVLLWLGILDFFRERYDMVWRKGDWAIYRLKSP
ncbi:hypothetical protein HY251_09475 [bacterium]|nr:hypothetical protein [bacterium]